MTVSTPIYETSSAAPSPIALPSAVHQRRAETETVHHEGERFCVASRRCSKIEGSNVLKSGGSTSPGEKRSIHVGRNCPPRWRNCGLQPYLRVTGWRWPQTALSRVPKKAAGSPRSAAVRTLASGAVRGSIHSLAQSRGQPVPCAQFLARASHPGTQAGRGESVIVVLAASLVAPPDPRGWFDRH